MNIERYRKILKYGWRYSKSISSESKRSRLSVFMDIMTCYHRYNVYSGQYKKERVWTLSQEARMKLFEAIGKKNRAVDEWQKDYDENRHFLAKYSGMDWDLTKRKREERYSAYAKRYNAGKDIVVQHDVEISRAHGLKGTIKIGEHVLLAKHVFIDYSGGVEIGNNVKLTNGVIIETHRHDLEAYVVNNEEIQTGSSLFIGDNVFVGARAIILDSCNYIGKNSRIGAGAVVTKDVPDNSLVAGVPARVIKTLEFDFLKPSKIEEESL